jgi:hypothetical protein
MLPINDGELASFDGSNDHRRKLRPVEIFSDLIDIYSAATADFTLICDIDHQLAGVDPLKERSWSWRKFGTGRAETLGSQWSEHGELQFRDAASPSPLRPLFKRFGSGFLQSSPK